MSHSISQFIYKGPHSQVLLFTMELDQYLKPHRALVDILIIAATGSLEIGEGLAKHTLNAGDHITFEKNIQHSVLALTPASFYLIKLAPHEQQNATHEHQIPIHE